MHGSSQAKMPDISAHFLFLIIRCVRIFFSFKSGKRNLERKGSKMLWNHNTEQGNGSITYSPLARNRSTKKSKTMSKTTSTLACAQLSGPKSSPDWCTSPPERDIRMRAFVTLVFTLESALAQQLEAISGCTRIAAISPYFPYLIPSAAFPLTFLRQQFLQQ